MPKVKVNGFELVLGPIEACAGIQEFLLTLSVLFAGSRVQTAY